MTDKEILEFAAKAAGFANWNYVGGSSGICVELGASRGDITSYWNPLTNDGDALRLAVKLEMQVSAGYRCIEVGIVSDGDESAFCLSEPKIGDLYAATRRAIVRAAAEIGKAMR